MAHWYTADLHFGHANIIRLCNRPFRDADQMDAILMENLRSRVDRGDHLWIVGDFAFGRRSKDTVWLRELFDQLPGARKHLIIGNHDNCHTRALPWDSLSHLVELKDGPRNSRANTLCHYPMVTWNHSRRGALQLFGHVHDNWAGTRNSINVGVDLWDFMPMRIEDIRKRGQELPVSLYWDDAEPGADLGQMATAASCMA